MIKILKTVTMSPEQCAIVIEGMRNSFNSWDKSDSCMNPRYRGHDRFYLGEEDYNLMQKLAKCGPAEAKYRRMMPVWVTLEAPLYWWKEMDTYKVGTVRNSCSTMHKITEKEFTIDDFSVEHISTDEITGLPFTTDSVMSDLEHVISKLNACRVKYLQTKDKLWWWQIIQLLPSSYNQRATLMLNYEVLANIYHQRKNHKLDEWKEFCAWIEGLPCSKLITGENDNTLHVGAYKRDVDESEILRDHTNPNFYE